MTKEICIENASNLMNIITSIKGNFEQENPSNIVIRFKEDITKEDMLLSLKELWKFEVDTGHTVDILIKNLPYDYRKDALGLALKTENLQNPIFLSNVFCLIKGYNTFADAYFEHEQVFLNDEVEFLDIFDDLEQEIADVSLKVAEYYVSMLKTCHLVDAAVNNPNAVQMENLYVHLFECFDALVLSRVLSSVKDNTIWETKKIVLGSLNYLSIIAEKFVFSGKMMELLLSQSAL